jgi:integrase
MLVTSATDEGSVIHVRGKGGTNRRIPIEQKLIEALDSYRDSRAVRFPRWQQTPPYCQRIGCVAATAPLFVGSDGERITRGTLQYCVLRASRKAGPRRSLRRRCTRPCATPHLRQRTGQRRRQRLHVDEVTRSRIDDHLVRATSVGAGVFPVNEPGWFWSPVAQVMRLEGTMKHMAGRKRRSRVLAL